MNFGFSGEMVFIFFLALILFGPKKLPEMGRTVARFLNEFRRASNEFRSQIESEIDSLDTTGSKHSSSRPFGMPTQAPLGSLASRIFNPPPPEKMEAAEEAVAEQAAVKAAAEASVAERESHPETLPHHEGSKAAPDA